MVFVQLCCSQSLVLAGATHTVVWIHVSSSSSNFTFTDLYLLLSVYSTWRFLWVIIRLPSDLYEVIWTGHLFHICSIIRVMRGERADWIQALIASSQRYVLKTTRYPTHKSKSDFVRILAISATICNYCRLVKLNKLRCYEILFTT